LAAASCSPPRPPRRAGTVIIVTITAINGAAIGAGIAGFAAGAIPGGLAAQPHYDYAPGYAYAPPPRGGVAYCERHFRTYNPDTGLYRDYDGRYHPCP
jgi:hypothetical protein